MKRFDTGIVIAIPLVILLFQQMSKRIRMMELKVA